ncbi:chemotaxis protein CheW [Herbaspirillum chlorophenolicum]|uniref:Chemotaxis protein CheW n=1 Tax=Herbaspirillum chlorophenolicum TaxID=211589 RepID=A0ABW8EZ75_9BURK
MTQKLFLLFHIGRDRYALPASDVEVVLPLAQFKQVPGTPPWVAGLFSYGGRHVPVIDISRLSLDMPADVRLSTRLVLVRYAPAGAEPRLLGLVLEKATDTLYCDPQDFLASGLHNEQARYLGPVMRHRDGLLQWITVDALLDADTRALLFPPGHALAGAGEAR